MYDNNINLTSNAKVSSTSCKSRDLWVTDFTILPNVNKIALAFTTKEIGKNLNNWMFDWLFSKNFNYNLDIYDCSKFDFICQFKITNLPSIAFALDYW